MGLLKDKTAVIIGASKGIGAQISKIFAAQKAKLALVYKTDTKNAKQTLQEVSKNSKALLIQADTTQKEDVTEIFANTAKAFGSIDVLVLCAAFGFKTAPFLKQTWQDFEPKLLNEMKSAFFCTQEAARYMKAQNSGSIIVISSDLSSSPKKGFIAHSATKSALDALARSLANELGDYKIRVNLIAPGLTITKANENLPKDVQETFANASKLKRNATPTDIANTAVFLASDLSSFVTGEYIRVNGGANL